MTGGRPSQGKQQRYSELEELAEWFKRAIADLGLESVHAFLQRNRMLDKHLVYGLAGATRQLKLEEVRALAAALGRRPQEAETIWRRAKRASDRRIARVTVDNISSWHDLPSLPDLPLRDLLEAQCESIEQLPYRKLMVEPPRLSAIYVRQRVRLHGAPTRQERSPVEEKGRDTATGDILMPVADALNRHEHLLVTGEPGSGKSTLGYYFSGMLARAWLSDTGLDDISILEPVAPLRVPARELVRDGVWSNVLAAAATSSLQLNLVADIAPQILERRVHGARWLIFVDGLDEISDLEKRNNLIRALSHHAKPGGDFRFVVSTRPLPDAELAPLRGDQFGRYEVEPFGRKDLEAFAHRWFEAQDPSHSKELAARYLHQIADSRLRELVRNPLIATIAAVIHTKEPDTPLPTSRIDLYERCYGYLVQEETSGRKTLPEVRRNLTDQPNRLRLIEWAHLHLKTIIEHLGRIRVESETPLLEAATGWVRENIPRDSPLGSNWEDDVRQLLIGTGVFVHEGKSIRFLHYSFAEFLSAHGFAATLPSDANDLTGWLWRWRKESSRNLVLFTLILWGRRPGHDAGALVERLARGGPDQVVLAGRLLAEGADLSPEVAGAVVSRLIDLAVATDNSDHYDVLAAMCENRLAATGLREILGWDELPIGRRMKAATALSRVSGSTETVTILRELAAETRGQDRVDISRALINLVPETQRPEIGLLLEDLANEQDADSSALAAAAEALHDLNLSRQSETLVQAALYHPLASGWDFANAASIWLKLRGPSIGNEILEAARQRDVDAWGRACLADHFVDVGRGDLAMILIPEVFQDPTADGIDLGYAARAWHKAVGPDSVADIAHAVYSRPVLHFGDRVNLCDKLVDAGLPALAIEIVQPLVQNPQAEDWKLADLANMWVKAAGPAGGDRLATLIEDQAGWSLGSLAALAEALADCGCRESATRLARRVLEEPGADGSAMGSAAKAWQTASGGIVSDQIAALVANHPRLSRWDQVQLASTLAEADCPIAADLARSSLEGEVGGYLCESAITAILRIRGAEAVEELASLPSIHRSPDSLISAARAFTSFGARQTAAVCLIAVLTNAATDPSQAAEASAQLLMLGARSFAIDELQRLLDSAHLAPRQRAIARAAVAWITLMHPAAASSGLDDCSDE